MSEYLNTNNISKTTHALFDAFAEQIMEHDLTGLLKASPHPEISNDELTNIVLKNWGKNGLMSLVPQADFTALDIATATIMLVLKKRGFSIESLKEIKTALGAPIYKGISILEFVVLMCRKQATSGTTPEQMPLLVIDGENCICIALANDIPALVCDEDYPSYSHTVLNLYRVLNECEFAGKIATFGINPFLELPDKIAARLLLPETRRLVVDFTKNCLITESNGDIGDIPPYGEVTAKYQDRKIVSATVKNREFLYDE
ncbi:MAG: hypothetical protein IKO56_09980 [Alphaproteobacteria bacterium]|nr:hypothetical protein [Alphaproteobacteria bacterium]